MTRSIPVVRKYTYDHFFEWVKARGMYFRFTVDEKTTNYKVELMAGYDVVMGRTVDGNSRRIFQLGVTENEALRCLPNVMEGMELTYTPYAKSPSYNKVNVQKFYPLKEDEVQAFLDGSEPPEVGANLTNEVVRTLAKMFLEERDRDSATLLSFMDMRNGGAFSSLDVTGKYACAACNSVVQVVNPYDDILWYYCTNDKCKRHTGMVARPMTDIPYWIKSRL